MKIFIYTFSFVFFVSSLFGQDTLSQKKAKVLPVLFHQHAAEYRALCYQAFNAASLHLETIKKKRKGLPLAIITDIDETVLDNSYYEAQRIKDGKEFTAQSWKNWTDRSAATLVPGAADFFNKVKRAGIEIFYLSNRDTSEIRSTVSNFKKLHLPDADLLHMIFRKDKASKEIRRQQIMNRYNVVMLIGDNLNDFAELFEMRNSAERKNEVDKMKEAWGTKFIVLPNAIYGEWENALYDYKRNLTSQQKNDILMEKLVGY